jgi:hypothetical protein
VRLPNSALIATTTVAAAMAVSSRARAIPCNEVPNAANPDAGAPPPVVYIEGANAVLPFIAPLQQALSVDPNPITLVYIGDGGCLGASNFFANAPISPEPAPIYYIDKTQATCDLPTGASGQPPVADIAASDVYASTCGTLPGGLPPNVGDFLGPIQSMVFVVPTRSTQNAISNKGAYFVFGFGADSGAAPWTVNASIYRRDASSAVQALLSYAIGVPLTRWLGVDASTLAANVNDGLSGAGAVVHALDIDPNPEQAIGILADTSIDAAAATQVTVLAYKDSDESCAYYPDSTPSVPDKANVRDGHYTLWGPLHFFTNVDAEGVPQDPTVARVISYLNGTADAPGGLDFIQTDASSKLVPLCAMHVARTTEMGPLMSYAPTGSCSCYYDYVATGQSSCQKCTQEADCPESAPICNLSYPAGFCEPE